MSYSGLASGKGVGKEEGRGVGGWKRMPCKKCHTWRLKQVDIRKDQGPGDYEEEEQLPCE